MGRIVWVTRFTKGGVHTPTESNELLCVKRGHQPGEVGWHSPPWGST